MSPPPLPSMSIEKPKSSHVVILPHREQSEARPKPSRKTFTLHPTRFRTLANYITRPTTEAGIVSPACQHRIRLIRSEKAPTEFLKVDEGAMRGLHVPLSCVHHPPVTREAIHTETRTRTILRIRVSALARLGVPSCQSWGRRLISTSSLRGG